MRGFQHRTEAGVRFRNKKRSEDCVTLVVLHTGGAVLSNLTDFMLISQLGIKFPMFSIVGRSETFFQSRNRALGSPLERDKVALLTHIGTPTFWQKILDHEYALCAQHPKSMATSPISGQGIRIRDTMQLRN